MPAPKVSVEVAVRSLSSVMLADEEIPLITFPPKATVRFPFAARLSRKLEPLPEYVNVIPATRVSILVVAGVFANAIETNPFMASVPV
jgi:hypothetical protein